MGLFDSLTNALGLDDKIADAADALVERLEALRGDNKLDDLAQNALTAFKPVLAKFKVDQETLEGLLEKAKDLLNALDKADLPDELEALVNRVKAFVK